MAAELTLRASLSFSKGSTLIDLALAPFTRDVAGTNGLKNRQKIGITEEAVLVGDVAAAGDGYFIGINRDATNFIELRPGTGGTDLIKLLPGDVALFRLSDAALWAISDTAECELEYAIIDL